MKFTMEVVSISNGGDWATIKCEGSADKDGQWARTRCWEMQLPEWAAPHYRIGQRLRVEIKS